jgi:hypothetical protein
MTAKISGVNARISTYERIQAIKKLQEQQYRSGLFKTSRKAGATNIYGRTRSNSRASLISDAANPGLRRFEAVAEVSENNDITKRLPNFNAKAALNNAMAMRLPIALKKQPKFNQMRSLSALKSKKFAGFVDNDLDSSVALPVSRAEESSLNQSDSQSDNSYVPQEEYTEKAYEADVQKYNLFDALNKYENVQSRNSQHKKSVIAKQNDVAKNTHLFHSAPIEVGEKMHGALMQRGLWQKLEASRPLVTPTSLILSAA